MHYAGFWSRTLAAIIDGVIISLVTGFLVQGMGAVLMPGTDLEALLTNVQGASENQDISALLQEYNAGESTTTQGQDPGFAALTKLSEQINTLTAQMQSQELTPEQMQQLLSDGTQQHQSAQEQYGQLLEIFAILVMMLVAAVLFVSLYETLSTASKMRGTPGKWVLGMVVIDEQGQPLSFGTSLARHGAKGVSALLLMIGFIMVAFDTRKQGLHDKMCKTLVVTRRSIEGVSA